MPRGCVGDQRPAAARPSQPEAPGSWKQGLGEDPLSWQLLSHQSNPSMIMALRILILVKCACTHGTNSLKSRQEARCSSSRGTAHVLLIISRSCTQWMADVRACTHVGTLYQKNLLMLNICYMLTMQVVDGLSEEPVSGADDALELIAQGDAYRKVSEQRCARWALLHIVHSTGYIWRGFAPPIDPPSMLTMRVRLACRERGLIWSASFRASLML